MSNHRHRDRIGHGGGALPGAVAVAAPAGAAPQIHGGMQGHHHGPHWRGGPWLYGGLWPYPVAVPSTGIEINDILTAAEAAESSEEEKKKDVKTLAKEIVKQLKKGVTVVGDDLELLDAETVGEGGGGFNWGGLLQAAGGLAEAGISIAEKEQAKKDAEAAKGRSSAEEQAKIQAAIAADAVAAKAAARAAFTAQSKLPSAAIDASAASQAAAAQARAAAGLSPESHDKRFEAANKAWAAATAQAQANPKNAQLVALTEAWQATVNKIQNAQFVPPSGGPSAGSPQPSGDGGGWWRRLLRFFGLE